MPKSYRNLADQQAIWKAERGIRVRVPKPLFISTMHGRQQYYTVPAALDRGLVKF